jgi:GDP-D-mannose 3',5'-epimerase
MKKCALVLGAGGFIGSHLVMRLKRENYWVRGVDLKYPSYGNTEADDFVIGDLRNPVVVAGIMAAPGKTAFDEVYQLAADMGGAGYIFSGENDADVMHNSSLVNLNVVHEATRQGAKKIFYSSSACAYPEYNQEDPLNPKCSEDSVYPANPDSEYGWEKLFSERLYLSFMRNYGLEVRLARFHNIFGPMGTWKGGKEKAPAALCRKVIECPENSFIEVWGDGSQTRSFLFIDECLEGIRRLMDSDFSGPVNIGSEEMLSINDFANMIIGISGKNISIKNVPGFTGVRGRNSDNKLIFEKLGWKPSAPLIDGMRQTYHWIEQQVKKETLVSQEQGI